MPRYLKGLLISLLAVFITVIALRYLGFSTRSLTDEEPKSYIFILALVLPLLSLSLDWRSLKQKFLSIEQEDRLPLLLIFTAQLSSIFSYWFSIYLLLAYLLLILGRTIYCQYYTKETSLKIGELRSNLKAKIKEIPIYVWCLPALFLLNLLGLLWQKQPIFPNTADKYLPCLLLPLSLLLYRPKLQSVYAAARFVLPFILAFLSLYLIYAQLYHLFYFDKLWAWLLHPLSVEYQREIFHDYTYKLFSDWLDFNHPSYVLLSILPIFFISVFTKKRDVTVKFEELVFVCLSFLFVGLTHLRYGICFVLLMTIFCFYKPYVGMFGRVLRRYFYVPILILVGLAAFIYKEQDLFSDNLRFELYINAIKQIKAFPILGQGSGAESKLFFKPFDGFFAHTHNLFLSMMVNFGLLGLIWCLALLRSMLSSYKKNKALFSFTLFFIPLMLIDNPFVETTSLMISLFALYTLCLLKYTKA